MGEEVAESVVVAGGDGRLGLGGVDFIDCAHLVFDVGVPAKGVGEEVGGGFGKFDVTFYCIFSDAVGVTADGGE